LWIRQHLGLKELSIKELVTFRIHLRYFLSRHLLKKRLKVIILSRRVWLKAMHRMRMNLWLLILLVFQKRRSKIIQFQISNNSTKHIRDRVNLIITSIAISSKNNYYQSLLRKAALALQSITSHTLIYWFNPRNLLEYFIDLKLHQIQNGFHRMEDV